MVPNERPAPLGHSLFIALFTPVSRGGQGQAPSLPHPLASLAPSPFPLPAWLFPSEDPPPSGTQQDAQRVSKPKHFTLPSTRDPTEYHIPSAFPLLAIQLPCQDPSRLPFSSGFCPFPARGHPLHWLPFIRAGPSVKPAPFATKALPFGSPHHLHMLPKSLMGPSKIPTPV